MWWPYSGRRSEVCNGAADGHEQYRATASVCFIVTAFASVTASEYSNSNSATYMRLRRSAAEEVLSKSSCA